MAVKVKEKPNYQKRDGTLIFQKSFSTQLEKAEIEERIIAYLEALDYKPKSAAASLIYDRGSMMAGYYSLAPRNLYAIMAVNLSNDLDLNTDINVTLTIRLAGSMPLKRDFDFWQVELEGLESAVIYDYINPLHSLYASDRSRWFGCWLMSLIIFIGSLGFLALLSVITVQCMRC